MGSSSGGLHPRATRDRAQLIDEHIDGKLMALTRLTWNSMAKDESMSRDDLSSLVPESTRPLLLLLAQHDIDTAGLSRRKAEDQADS